MVTTFEGWKATLKEERKERRQRDKSTQEKEDGSERKEKKINEMALRGRYLAIQNWVAVVEVLEEKRGRCLASETRIS